MKSDSLAKRVEEYRKDLMELLQDEQVVRELLRDEDTRYKLLFVAGALKIPISLEERKNRSKVELLG